MQAKIKTALGPIGRIPLTVWLVLFLASAVISAVSLRHNNLTAVHLYNQVQSADKNDQDVEQALGNLQAYVTGHMNTNLATTNGVYPPIQLTYTYQRLTKTSTVNTYHDAQIYCEKHQPVGFYGAYRIGCVESYIESHPSSDGPKADIPAALYEFDFISPSWSPDLAGWSLVATGFFFLVSLVKFLPGRLR